MINKQNMWFVTLFSLILILGLYYISMDDEVATVLKSESTNENRSVIEITPSDVLVALEVENDEEKQALMEEYQNILLDGSKTIEEKNAAYEKIQTLNSSSSDEEKIKDLINKKFNLKSFVKITNNNISVVIADNKHDNVLANSIIRSIQELYKDNKYITVKFNK